MARTSDDKTRVSVLWLQVARRRRYTLYSLFSSGRWESTHCSWGFLDFVWSFITEWFMFFVWKMYCCPVYFSVVSLYEVVDWVLSFQLWRGIFSSDDFEVGSQGSRRSLCVLNWSSNNLGVSFMGCGVRICLLPSLSCFLVCRLNQVAWLAFSTWLLQPAL